jgi:MSHA biogenesis protein MshO
MHHTKFQRGFTLVELIMVIVIMGIVSGMVAVFMKSPIDAYVASARRAAMTDVADTALRRIARDIRKALPNSVHAPTNQCMEFIPTKTGGRYRAAVDSAGNGDILDFTVADTSFDMLGANSTLTDQAIAGGDIIAVYNLGVGMNDAYLGDDTATVKTVSSGNPANITLVSGKQFPLASASNRFHVIPANEKVVAFVCSGGNIYRTANTSMTKTADGSSCSTSGSSTMTVAILASNVGSCSFVYGGSDLQRNGLVQLSLQLTNSGESVNLYDEIHVDNTP